MNCGWMRILTINCEPLILILSFWEFHYLAETTAA
jgi:hypothetical protein